MYQFTHKEYAVVFVISLLYLYYFVSAKPAMLCKDDDNKTLSPAKVVGAYVVGIAVAMLLVVMAQKAMEKRPKSGSTSVSGETDVASTPEMQMGA